MSNFTVLGKGVSAQIGAGMLAVAGSLIVAQPVLAQQSLALNDQQLALLEEIVGPGDASSFFFGVPTDMMQSIFDLEPGEDGESVVFRFEMPGPDGMTFDGSDMLSVGLVATPSQDGESVTLSALPTPASIADPAEGEMSLGPVTLEGIWNRDSRTYSQLSLDVGEISMDSEEVELGAGGLSLFVGPLTEYDGELPFKSPSPADVTSVISLMIGDIDVLPKLGEGEEGWFKQDASYFVSTLFPPQGSDLAAFDYMGYLNQYVMLMVEGIAAGGPEAIEEMVMGGDLQYLEDLMQLGMEVFGYEGISEASIGSGELRNRDSWEDSFFSWAGAGMSAKQSFNDLGNIDSNAKFELGEIYIDTPEVELTWESTEFWFDLANFDAQGFVDNYMSLLSDTGDYGQFYDLIVDVYGRWRLSAQVSGIEVALIDPYAEPEMLEEPESVSIGSLLYDMDFTQFADQGKASITFGFEGVNLAGLPAEDIEPEAVIFTFDGNEDGIADFGAQSGRTSVTLSGLPMAEWREVLANIPREYALLDLSTAPEAIEEELPLVGLQLLAPLLASTPTVDFDAIVSLPQTDFTAQGQYNINPMLPPMFGTSQARIAASDLDALLVDMLKAGKAASRAASQLEEGPQQWPMLDAADMFGELSELLRAVRTILERDANGATVLDIELTSLGDVLINGESAEEFEQRFEDALSSQ